MSKLPPAGCYKLLLKRLGPVDSLSLRKRMCLAFLAWKLYGRREDQETLVDTAKEFRKLPGRRGSNRTPVEKEARKHFRAVKKHRGLEVSREAAREYAKGQRDRGEGIHSPEELELKKERWKAVRQKQIATRNHPHAKVYVVTYPDGTEYRVKGLGTWSRDMGMNNTGMHATANRPWEKSTYKGYKARHYDELMDGDVPWLEGYEPLPWNE